MDKSVEQIYDDVRKRFLGLEIDISEPLYPVEYDPIRRYCHMVDDDNPLYLNEEYAKKTSYGGVICPPLAIEYFATHGAWPPPYCIDSLTPILQTIPTPGDRNINLSTEWEFFKPVRVGDWLKAKIRILDIYIKPIRLDPQAFWILTETTITNQEHATVATMRNLILRHRSQEQVSINRSHCRNGA